MAGRARRGDCVPSGIGDKDSETRNTLHIETWLRTWSYHFKESLCGIYTAGRSEEVHLKSKIHHQTAILHDASLKITLVSAPS